MQPNEQFKNRVESPVEDLDQLPPVDAGEPFNGQYNNEAEFRAAEAAYSLNINTVNLEGGANYPIATAEGVTTWQSEDTTKAETLPSIEVTDNERLFSRENTDEVIDVEAKEVRSEAAALEKTEERPDLSELIDSSDEIEVEGEKLQLTPKLKAVAKGVLSSLEQLLKGDEAELPEEVDWRPYIMSEPDYDESYDYITLHRLLNAEYKRRRVARFSGESLADIIAADILGGTPPPPNTPETPTQNEGEDAGAEKAEVPKAENDILKIEMDKPEAEVPNLEYKEKKAPALTYEEKPGQNETKQITQQ